LFAAVEDEVVVGLTEAVAAVSSGSRGNIWWEVTTATTTTTTSTTASYQQ